MKIKIFVYINSYIFKIHNMQLLNILLLQILLFRKIACEMYEVLVERKGKLWTIIKHNFNSFFKFRLM